MKTDQKTRQRRQDELAFTHAKMLRVMQSNAFKDGERAHKMTTTIETDSQTHSCETYRSQSGEIGHNIRSQSTKPTGAVSTGEENKERGA